MTRTPRLLAPLLAMALAACGGSSTKTTAAPTTPAPTETAPTGPTVDPAAPWGAEVASPDGEKAARALLESLAGGTVDQGAVVIIGPLLWVIVGKDPELADGIPMVSQMSVGDQTMTAEGRGFSSVHGLGRATKSVTFQKLGENFGRGTIRPATADERRAWYASISFEIAGEPVSVVELGDLRLLVYISVSDAGRMIYLDDADGWMKMFGAK